MEMTISSCGPTLGEYAIGTAILFFAPIGAWVFRRHIAAAAGLWKLAGVALQALALASAPFAVLFVLSLVSSLLW